MSGGAFAVNALVEADHIDLLGDAPVAVPVTGTSGREQTIMRCRKCQVALWSHYPGAGPGVAFVRVGTLNDPGSLPPDIHIFTSTKLPWLAIPPDAQAVEEFYDPAAVWSAENRHRFALARKA